MSDTDTAEMGASACSCGHHPANHSRYGCSVCASPKCAVADSPGAVIEFDGSSWWARCAWCIVVSGPFATIDEAMASVHDHDDEAGHRDDTCAAPHLIPCTDKRCDGGCCGCLPCGLCEAPAGEHCGPTCRADRCGYHPEAWSD